VEVIDSDSANKTKMENINRLLNFELKFSNHYFEMSMEFFSYYLIMEL